ncbi:MAG: GNAT family N-acetyltransferase, partial [Chloroflexi bacterium]|nr:GNAT family N-acetyltransferase [Chloroflexota bacterium]
MRPTIQLPERIELERLVLVKPQFAHADALFGWTSDPEVTRYLSFRPHQSIDESRRLLCRWIQAWEESEGRLTPGRALVYLIEMDATAVGSLSVYAARYGYELAYALARSHWGKGIMPHAVRGLTEWLLAHGAGRVFATAHVANRPSHRVLEKAGFVREGRLQKYFYFP